MLLSGFSKDNEKNYDVGYDDSLQNFFWRWPSSYNVDAFSIYDDVRSQASKPVLNWSGAVLCRW